MPNIVWSSSEEEFIIKNADRLTDEEAAIALSNLAGRPISKEAYTKKRKRLGIKKAPGRGLSRRIN